MKDVLPIAAQWVREQRAFAAATVVAVRGSAPRELGATMLVDASGGIAGNVSGGCVEGAVVDEAFEVLASGRPTVQTYGISDDAVMGVGLMCGGAIDVLVRPVHPGSVAASQIGLLAASVGQQVALVLVVSGDALGEAHLVGAGDDSQFFASDAAARAGDDRAQLLQYDADGCLTATDVQSSVLVVPFGAAPRLIVVGAVAIAAALARVGAAMGYRVTVVDARSAFAVAEHFADAEVINEWPDRYLARALLDAQTAVAVLSHDPKFDVPALVVALASEAGFVGAMGSRRTHFDRLERLAEAGVSAAQRERLRSPIGLDLGGRSPEETALSILAEIVAVRNGAAGGALSARGGDIHLPAGAAQRV